MVGGAQFSGLEPVFIVGKLIDEIWEKISGPHFGLESFPQEKRREFGAPNIQNFLSYTYLQVIQDSRDFHISPICAGFQKEPERAL